MKMEYFADGSDGWRENNEGQKKNNIYSCKYVERQARVHIAFSD